MDKKYPFSNVLYDSLEETTRERKQAAIEVAIVFLALVALMSVVFYFGIKTGGVL
jgi:hypothetical protein